LPYDKRHEIDDTVKSIYKVLLGDYIQENIKWKIFISDIIELVPLKMNSL